MLKVAITAVVALVLGSIAFVVHHESSKPKRQRAAAVDAAEEVSTISSGERVDVESYVTSTGLLLVEFTAEF